MIFVLENIRSKFNIGSIFRTCDAFQVEELVLVGYSVYPPDKEISKTAIGAERFVKWQYFQNIEDALEKFKNEGRKIVGVEIDTKAVSIENYNTTGNEVFIFGNEISGVSKKTLNLCDEILMIPMKGKIKESLNVGVSAGIIGAFAYTNSLSMKKNKEL